MYNCRQLSRLFGRHAAGLPVERAAFSASAAPHAPQALLKGGAVLKYVAGLGAAALGGTAAAQNDEVAATLRVTRLAVVRLARDVYVASSIVAGARRAGCWGCMGRDSARLSLAQFGPGSGVTPPPLAAADYRATLDGAPAEGAEREQLLNDCHQRSADRLLQLCFANGGIYTKVGARGCRAAAHPSRPLSPSL